MKGHAFRQRPYHMAGVTVLCCCFTVGLMLFMSSQSGTSPSVKPVTMTAVVEDRTNQGVIMCAYDDTSLRLAWVQVRKSQCSFT